jgi:hypothetical protein
MAITGSLRVDLETVARMAVREVLLQAMEAEITEFLGRDVPPPPAFQPSDDAEVADDADVVDWAPPNGDVRFGVNTLKAVLEAMATR